MAQSSGFQPLTCKKCGGGGFYHPSEEEDTGSWNRIDKFGNVNSFEKPFEVPHWYVCPATPQGTEHRQKMQEQLTRDQQEYVMQKDKERIDRKVPLPQGQKLLPSEKLTDLDRSIAEKLHVIELLIKEIKDILSQKSL